MGDGGERGGGGRMVRSGGGKEGEGMVSILRVRDGRGERGTGGEMGEEVRMSMGMGRNWVGLFGRGRGAWDVRFVWGERVWDLRGCEEGVWCGGRGGDGLGEREGSGRIEGARNGGWRWRMWTVRFEYGWDGGGGILF